MSQSSEAGPQLESVRVSKAAARALRREDHKRRQDARAPKPLVAKTKNQGRYIDLLNAGESVFAIGGAGTGKTYIIARIAARKLIDGDIDKIIISRVTVSDPRHKLGFLPGKIEAKMAPWVRPVIDGLRAEVSASTLEQWQQEGRFEVADFEHIRGRTFDRCLLLLDEAQNATFQDLRTFTTRTGMGTQIVVTGDIDQVDIPDSGLERVVEMIERFNVPVQVVRFTDDDVVRSPLAKAFVKAFAAEAGAANLDNLPAFLDAKRLPRAA